MTKETRERERNKELYSAKNVESVSRFVGGFGFKISSIILIIIYDCCYRYYF